MTDSRLTPYGSQTVGPFFDIGLSWLIERCPVDSGVAGAIEIRGRVLDGDGLPVPDAVLEFWSAENPAGSNSGAYPRGFRRAFTDAEGNFSVRVSRPSALPLEDGGIPAPHLLVLVFARGLLRHLLSRVYFDDERANESDAVLAGIPAERRRTMIARRDEDNTFRWSVILQGSEETVFFAW